jgi:hypothetical protein
MTRKLIFQESSEHRQHFLLSFISFFFLTMMRIFGPWGNNKPLIRLKNMFSLKNKHFLLGVAGIVIWSIFILGFNGASYFTDDDNIFNSYIEATKHAVLAFIVAIFAKLELTIPVFGFIWLTAFYLDGWG